jgi:hypothetical protein
MADTPYRRLTWAHSRHSGFVVFTHVRSSLWLGADHVLVIDSSGYSETYKRFYFQDIQAVTVRVTRRRLLWNWLLGVPAFIWAAGGASAVLLNGISGLPEIIGGVTFPVLLAIPLLINNLLGPTCACQLQTAVQTEQLPSLCRLRKTRRILDRLRPLIAQAQGQLVPEEIPARLRAWQEATAAEAAAAAEPRYVVDDPNAPPRIIS